MKIIIRVFLLTFLVSSFLFADEVLVGGLFDISGPTAKVGKPYFQGVRDYFNYHNSLSFTKRKIKLVYYDTRYNPDKAKMYAQALIQRGVTSIIGWGTGSSFSIRGLVNDAHIPYIPASFCKELLTHPYNKYIFLSAFSYADEMNTIIRFIATNPKFKYKSVAIISNPSDFGTKPIPPVRKYASGKVNLSLIYYFPLNPNPDDTTKLRQELSKIKPDIIIAHTIPGPFIKVIKTASEIPGYTPLAIFGTFYTYEPDIIPKIPRKLISHIFTINHFALWYENTPGMGKVRYYTRKKYGAPVKNVYYIEGWVNALIMAEGIKRVKGSVTGEKLRKAIESIKHFSTGGLTPPITFSPTDHFAIDELRILKINVPLQRFIAATSWISP